MANHSFKHAIYFVIGVALLSLSSQTIFANEINWRKLAENDIEWMFKTLKENHPGYALNDQKLLTRSAAAYKNALNYSKRVTDFNSYYLTLREAANAFQDMHVRVAARDLNSISRLKVQWPGFYVSYIDGVIHEGMYDGAKIISCDKKTPLQLFQERVLPFFGVKNILADAISWGPRTFLNLWPERIPPLKTCVIQKVNSLKKTKISLVWRDISFAEWNGDVRQYTLGPYPKAEAFLTSSNIFWIRIPTLLPNENEAQSYKNILAMPEFQSAKKIVFDLRGNGGGDSRWAEAFIKAPLNGDELVMFEHEKAKLELVTVKYRVGQENIARIRAVATNPVTGEIDPEMAMLANNLQRAMDAGNTLYSEQEIPNPVNTIRPVIQNSRPFYVITDGYCVSSCLAMMDMFKLFKNMMHLGQATGSDTGYLQINTLEMPTHSEVSDVHFLFTYTMAHFDRPWRGDNATYIPDYLFPGVPWNQKALENWAIDIINDDKH